MSKKLARINIVLLGPPGAGKGTQADLLKKEYGLLHVSTGDMLREAIRGRTEAGLEAEKYMTGGELVPDDIVTRLVLERMSKPDALNGVMLDGYPRTKLQAISLDDALSDSPAKVGLVLYFRTSEEVAVQRLSGRRVCPECKKNYHQTNMPPAVPGVCDTCAVALLQREDDKPETVKNRLSVYQRQTEELITYYQEKGVLRELDGDMSAGELFEVIAALFRKEGLVNDHPAN
jgi:adenylate kinase